MSGKDREEEFKDNLDIAGVLITAPDPVPQDQEEETTLTVSKETLTASKEAGNIEEMGVPDTPVNTAMEASNINNLLSVELLDTLLCLLPPSDLKAAVLVCKYWNAIGEKSHLWTWMEFRVTKENLAVAPKIICLSRLAKVETITLGAMSMKVLLAIEKHEGVKVLVVEVCKEPFVNSNILARVIARIEEVHFKFAMLKAEQWVAIFKSLSNGAKLKKLIIVGKSTYLFAMGDSNIKVLDIGDNDLCLVETDSIAKTVGKIDLDLRYSCFWTSQQIEAIFKQLNKDDKLKTFNMRNVNLSFDDQVKTVRSWSWIEANLEEGDLGYTDLTTQQLEAIFLAIKSRRQLKVLNL